MRDLTIHDRTFVIGEPNALHLVRLLAVVGRVGTRAEKAAANLGKALLSQVIPTDEAAPGGEEDKTNTPLNTATLFVFLAALTPDDLLDVMAAMLQFDDEVEGTRWLRKHPPTLNHVVQALTANLENLGGITEAIANFTQMLGGLNLAGMLTAATAEETG